MLLGLLGEVDAIENIIYDDKILESVFDDILINFNRLVSVSSTDSITVSLSLITIEI